MRAWERVLYQEHCGNCGIEMLAGNPMQTITRNGLRRKLLRCGSCADGPVPPDLPENPVRLSLQERVSQIAMPSIQSAMPERTRGALRRRAQELPEWMPFKENREPGEDG